ncbi:7367_t:CDS:1, partial [Racocetra fulgida]
IRNKNNNYLAIVKAMDELYIFHSGYRTLAAIENEIPREYAISNAKNQLNNQMNNAIPIYLFNITNCKYDDNSDHLTGNVDY